jgi:aminopeptidase N
MWWPCKDHPSDEPDSMALHFSVPGNLVCASNGFLCSVDFNRDDYRTWNWFVSTPIDAYNVTLNLGPYQIFTDSFVCSTGDTLDMFLYLIPRYDQDQTDDIDMRAHDFIVQMKKNLEFLESCFGPYPFREDHKNL